MSGQQDDFCQILKTLRGNNNSQEPKSFLEPGETTPKTGGFEAVKAKNQLFFSFLGKGERCNMKSEIK